MPALTIDGELLTINGSPITIGATTGMTIINIAFGVNGVGGSLPDWNAVTTLDATLKFASMVDSDLNPTGVSLDFINIWNASNPNTIVAPTHGYPVLAADEYINVSGDVEREFQFIFPVAHRGLPHTMTFWGATGSTTGLREGTYEILDSGAGSLGGGTHDAISDGAANPLEIPFIMPDDGIVDMTAVRVAGNTALYLSVITISYTLDTGPPTLTTPYSIGTNNGPLFTITTSDTLSTIEGAGFFNDNPGYASLLKTGDVVLIQASDGTKMYNVTVDKQPRIISLSSGLVIA